MESTGRGWTTSVWTEAPTLQRPVYEQCLSGDLNIDEMTDLMCYTGQEGTWNIWLSSATGYKAALWTQGPSPNWPIDHQCVTGDFTGDSATDMACYPNVGDVWEMVLSR